MCNIKRFSSIVLCVGAVHVVDQHKGNTAPRSYFSPLGFDDQFPVCGCMQTRQQWQESNAANCPKINSVTGLLVK